jgi:hypothetical protein
MKRQTRSANHKSTRREAGKESHVHEEKEKPVSIACDEEDDFVPDETMYFIQLWEHCQGLDRDTFDSIFTPEDIVLLEELVNTQNFSVGLDLLRQKVAPIRKTFPEEIRDAARFPRCRRVKVQPVNEHVAPPELTEFRERMKHAKPFIAVSPKRASQMMEEEDDHNDVIDESGLHTIDNGSILKEQDDAYEKALFEDQMQQVIQESLRSYEMQNVNEPEPLWESTPSLPITNDTKTLPKVEKHKKITIPKEPDVNDSDAVTVQVTLPFKDGTKLERRFSVSCDLVGAIMGWLSNELEIPEENFRLCTNFPKQYYQFLTPLSACPIQRKRINFICEYETNK